MSVTVEVGYDEVAGQNLENLRQDVGPADIQLKKVKVLTR